MVQHVLSLLLFVMLALCAWADVLIYDNSNNCTAGCPFTDPSLWGGRTPGASDAMVVDAQSSIVLVVSGEQVTVGNLSITGDVTFWVTNGSTFAVSSSLRLDPNFVMFPPSLLKVDGNSMVYAPFMECGDITVSSGTIDTDVLDALNSTIKASNATFDTLWAFLASTVIAQDSSFRSLTTDNLYANGSVTFSTSPTINKYAQFTNNPNLTFGSGSFGFAGSNTRIDIHDCVVTLPPVSAGLGTNNTLSITASSPAYTVYLAGLSTGNSVLLEIGDGLQLTIDSVSTYSGSILAGANVLINLPYRNTTWINPESYSIGQLPTATGPFFVNVSRYLVTLTPLNGPFLNANITVNQGTTVVFDAPTQLPAQAGACTVSGPGELQIQDHLRCDGALNIGTVTLIGSSTLTAPSVVTPLLQVDSSSYLGALPAYINAPMITAQSTLLEFGGLNINGSFTQVAGWLNVSFSSSTNLSFPFLQATGKISISNASLYLSDNLQFWNQEGSITLLNSTSGSVDATFASIVQPSIGMTASRLTISQKGGTVTILYNEDTTSPVTSWLQKYRFIIFPVAGACVVLVSIGVIQIYRRNRRHHLYQSV